MSQKKSDPHKNRACPAGSDSTVHTVYILFLDQIPHASAETRSVFMRIFRLFLSVQRRYSKSKLDEYELGSISYTVLTILQK